MSFIRTVDLLTALKSVLEQIPLPGSVTGEKLFERVDFHENKKLREALQDLIILKQRVCIIVPGGDAYTNQQIAPNVYQSTRESMFDILIADRAYTKGGHEAVFGGPKNVGVLAMKDAVVDFLVERAQLGLAHVALTPLEGAQIEIADEQVKDSPGRECFVMTYTTPTGVQTIRANAQWPHGAS